MTLCLEYNLELTPESSLFALVPAGMLFAGSSAWFFKERTLSSLLHVGGYAQAAPRKPSGCFSCRIPRHGPYDRIQMGHSFQKYFVSILQIELFAYPWLERGIAVFFQSVRSPDFNYLNPAAVLGSRYALQK